jgi:manganese oxidase
MDRRTFLRFGSLAAGVALGARATRAQQDEAQRHGVAVTPSPRPHFERPPPRRVVAPGGQIAVHTPNGSTLPWRVVDGVKVGHLVAGVIPHEFSPGLSVTAWGYNGSTPGPTLEAIEGDRVRLYVTNRLPEATTVHWHGVVTPNGMDGPGGLNQPPIPVGETFVYEFPLNKHGTFMYHSHFDEMVQLGLGLMGMFVVHPSRPMGPPVARDFCLFAHEWRVPVGASRPNPLEMTDFNVLTFNSKSFPATEPLLVGRGERVRIRLGNVSAIDHHPIHLHGVVFQVVGNEGGFLPASARFNETTVLVPVGATRVIEFVPEAAGDWAMHCHMTHHLMTQMGHDIPPMIGVDTDRLDRRMRPLVPGYMSMGQTGMAGMGMMKMPIPPNSLPMRSAEGPFGHIDMAGMFSVIKVRERPDESDINDWYEHPPGTIASRADAGQMRRDGIDPDLLFEGG